MITGRFFNERLLYRVAAAVERRLARRRRDRAARARPAPPVVFRLMKLVTVKGKGVTARVLAWHENDVMAVEVSDGREQPTPINIDLRMLRHVEQYLANKNDELRIQHTVMVQTRDQTAASRLGISGGRIVLTQEFREGSFYNSSAVAVDNQCRKAKAKYLQRFDGAVVGGAW